MEHSEAGQRPLRPESDAARVRHFRFVEECLKGVPAPAPSALYEDSQTQYVLSVLRSRSGRVRVLDYGCGNMRLLRAVSADTELAGRVKYTGVDVTLPTDTAAGELARERGVEWEHLAPEKLRADAVRRFDVAVLMNLLHEVSVTDCAVIVEDIRRTLANQGTLVLVDMSTLPEGEGRAVPFYVWDIEALFDVCEDETYVTRSGITVPAVKVTADRIPPFGEFRNRLLQVLGRKVSLWVEETKRLEGFGSAAGGATGGRRVPAPVDDATALSLLSIFVAHGHARLTEEYVASQDVRKQVPPWDQWVTDAAVAAIEHFESYFGEHSEPPTYGELCEHVGRAHNYRAVEAAMAILMQPAPWAFFMPMFHRADNWGDSPLVATEVFDVFTRRYTPADIRRLGLVNVMMECEEDVNPRY